MQPGTKGIILPYCVQMRECSNRDLPADSSMRRSKTGFGSHDPGEGTSLHEQKHTGKKLSQRTTHVLYMEREMERYP